MEPYLKSNDLTMFFKYLDNAKVYLEYGSGGSTYQASIRNNIKSIFSIESDERWHDKLKAIIKDNSQTKYIHRDINTLPNSWGHPGPKCSDTQRKLYSEFPIIDDDVHIDLVLIDGRFRVACCLKLFKNISNNCIVCFDDFFFQGNNIILFYSFLIS